MTTMWITHLPLEKMAATSQMIFSYVFLWMKSIYLIKISPKIALRGPIDNNPALVWIMALLWIGDKPLSEPMLTWFTDAYIIVALGGDELMNVIYMQWLSLNCFGFFLVWWDNTNQGEKYLFSFMNMLYFIWIKEIQLCFTGHIFYLNK